MINAWVAELSVIIDKPLPEGKNLWVIPVITIGLFSIHEYLIETSLVSPKNHDQTIEFPSRHDEIIKQRAKSLVLVVKRDLVYTILQDIIAIATEIIHFHHQVFPVFRDDWMVDLILVGIEGIHDWTQ